MEKSEILEFLKNVYGDSEAIEVEQKGFWDGYEVWYSVFKNAEGTYGIPQCALVRKNEIKMCNPQDAPDIFLSRSIDSDED